jgi:ribose transport system ATP-binding protein
MCSIYKNMNLKLKNISKSFGVVKALQGIDFELIEGEVHAVCGENGAGKSTLMNILVGNYQPDEAGSIWINNFETKITDFNTARNLGISIVYQERSLIDTLSIAENIFANRSPVNKFGFIDYQTLNQKTKEILEQLGLFHLQPNTLVGELSTAQKQMVEIGKALSQNPKILILDEPTASITDQETEILFSIIKNLKKQQVSIIYISHRLAEIFQIADRVTVLKDGQYQGTQNITETSPEQLIKKMVGREIETSKRSQAIDNEVVLSVENLAGEKFSNINFHVKKGEIVALAGLVGAGRSEVARAIFGIDKKLGGIVHLNHQELNIAHPADALSAGIGYVPEDRKNQGLFLDMSVHHNIVSGIFAGNTHFSEDSLAEISKHFKSELRIQTPNLQQPVRLLSGGNQQKCVLARWLQINPKLLIIDEPTHGIDVGAKFEIYELLRNLAAKGTAILLISSELPEVLQMADRILVMYAGSITGELDRNQATEETILNLASGRELI